ncbi:hypothetical protein [Bacillus thuringiensis]|uniref:hypothetical protein n=1 Tax=Bacillus thuringiensis TaxID=1428 RepID=UPI00167222DC|nr:hypothetical protein [Bacillus thuringiensis]
MENKAQYEFKRKAHIMKTVEKHHKKKLNEFKKRKIEFATAKEEELIRYFYTE